MVGGPHKRKKGSYVNITDVIVFVEGTIQSSSFNLLLGEQKITS